MFTDKRFECLTIKEARDEIFQTQKFKTKYPWRNQYKNKIVALGNTIVKTEEYKLYFDTIKKIIANGSINSRTNKFFNLSIVDQKIAAYCSASKYNLTTGDKDLIDFIKQEFSIENITPLGLINIWLKKGLIKWDDNLQLITEDWNNCGESAQTVNEISEFEKLTKITYNGPR